MSEPTTTDVELEFITPPTPEEKGELPHIEASSVHGAPPSPSLAPISRSSSISSDMNKTVETFDKENTSDSSSMEVSEDVLRLEAKGFMGFVERVPLWMKLLVMTLVCAVGLVAVGSWLVAEKGIAVSSTSRTFRYINFATSIQSASKKCQDERRNNRRYFANLIKKDDLIQFYSASTLQDDIAALLTTINSFNLQDSRLLTIAAKMAAYRTNLPEVRQNVLDKKITALGAFTLHTEFTTDLFAFVAGYVASTATSQEILQHLFFLKLRETQGKAYAYMQLYTSSRSSYEFQQQLASFIGDRDSALTLLKQVSTPTMLSSLNANMASTNYSFVAEVEKNITKMENNTRITFPSNFITISEGLLTQYEGLILAASEEIRVATANSLSSAVVGIVVVIVISIAILIGSLLVNFCVSTTVIGPWKRLNMLQEITMTKFVPRQFLNLLKCKKITDVTLGKNTVRDNLFIVQFSVHDFHKIVKQKKLNHDQTIQFINSFLTYFGEISRTFGGYVDRYYPDGFICLFTKSKNAIKCVAEMHRCIELFNTKVHTIVKPFITASISMVKASQTLIGAVGENDRIQPVLVSEDVAITHKLINLAYKYRVGMIIAKSAKKEFGKSYKFRLLGKLKLSEGDSTQIYELVDGNCPVHKVKTCKDFSSGVKAMLKQDYASALAKFDMVVKESKESDELAKFLKLVCIRQVERNKVAAHQLIVTDTLRDTMLKEGFEKYCQQERSVENIHLWTLLEDFKMFANYTSRNLIAQKVLSQYLSSTGDRLVNLSAEVRNKYQQQVKQVISAGKTPRAQEEIMNDNFFRGLQVELEFIMNDTHTRFKTTELFQIAFAKSKHSSPASCVVSSMNETLTL